MFTYCSLVLWWPLNSAKERWLNSWEEQVSFTAFFPADYQKIHPTSQYTKKTSFNLANNNLEILMVQHLGIVPGPDVCDLWLEVTINNWFCDFIFCCLDFPESIELF